MPAPPGGHTDGEVMAVSRKRSEPQSLELPQGFSMALARDEQAMRTFSGLSPQEKANVVGHTRRIRSEKEMRSYVRRLGEQDLQ